MSKANHRATREYASGRGMKSSGQFLNGGTPSHIDQPIPLCCVIGKGGIYRRHPLVRTQVGDRFTLAGSAIEGPAMITALQPSFRTDAAERQRHPPMGAAVFERPHFSHFIAKQHDRFAIKEKSLWLFSPDFTGQGDGPPLLVSRIHLTSPWM